MTRRARSPLNSDVSGHASSRSGKPTGTCCTSQTRVVIETQTGEVIAQQDNPRETFAGHAWETPWTPLQLGVLQRVRDVDLLQPSVSPRRTRHRGD